MTPGLKEKIKQIRERKEKVDSDIREIEGALMELDCPVEIISVDIRWCPEQKRILMRGDRLTDRPFDDRLTGSMYLDRLLRLVIEYLDEQDLLPGSSA